MQARRFGFGDILREALALLSANISFLAMVTALVAAGYIALDLTLKADASSIPSLVVGIFVQYLVLERLLARRAPDDGNRRYGAVFLAGLLGGIGILVGLILFIVPGLVLAAGWSAATAFVVVDRCSGTDALTASWRSTAASRWPIVGVYVATYVPFFVVFFAFLFLLGGAEGAGVVEGELAEDGPIAIVVTDILVSLLGTWGWVLGAAIYELAVPSDAGLTDVFG